jgi:hypothetical protein|nr:MAG TPA: coat protein [Inoviridae sp.]
MFKKLFSVLKSAFLAIGLGLGAVSATAADLTMGTDGTVTGTFNLSNVYAVGAAVFGALATIAAISICFRMIRKAS